MNASFRISLLYLLLIIPQHGNSPLPVMESWLQKDQDDGFVQRDMTSSLTGGDESFGSAHQTYQNSLIRKKKADNSGNALLTPGFRKFAAKFDRNQAYEQPNVFFNGRYMNKDYNPLAVDIDRNSFEGFDSNPAALTANKYHARTSNLENLNEENLNPRLLSKYKDEKNMALFGNRMNSFRADGLSSLNDDLGRNAKWSLCKRLKQRYAPNPLLAFSPAMEDRSNFNYNENGPLQNGYLIMDNDRRNRAIRNQEYRDVGRPEGKNPQIFNENEYYDMEENPATGEDDLNIEDEDYNQVLNGHSFMHKREEGTRQQPYNQKSASAQIVIDALTSKDAMKGFADDQTLLGAVPGGLTHVRMPKTRDLNGIPESQLTWKLDSGIAPRDLSDVVKDSQRALQEVQLFQQKYKTPEGSENDASKREGRNQPQMKLDKKSIEFDDKRLKREDEDEQKNMKTGTDEGGGGEYEDEEGKGHKDEEEYYEDADLSDEESGNEIRTTDRLNQKCVKREATADHFKKSKEKEVDISQDYELNLENAPVENAAKSRKSSYREGDSLFALLQICTATRKEMTTKNCLQRAVALAERLRERGVEKGDFIILFGNNSLNMNTALIGIFFLAAVPFPLTNKTSIEEFKIIIKYIKPKFYGCDKKHLYPFKKALLDISQYDTSRIFLLNKEEDPLEPEVEPFERFIKGHGTDFESFRPAEVEDPKEELALLMKAMTDGTDGRVVGITHHNINSVIARYDAKDDGVKLRNRVILMVQKVMWMSGIYALLLSCCYGSKLIVMNEFDEVNFMKAVEDYKVTTTFLYSSKLWQLSKFNYPTKYDLSSLKYIYAIDGSVPKGLIDGMKEKTGLILRPSYGLAEMTGLVLEPLGERKEGSTGKLVPQVIGKVVSDKSSQNLGPNERGELRFKGPTLSKGYINNVKSNRLLFDKEGFLLSGHYGYYDEDGDFFIIDKIFHVIKYKDYKLSPRELEGIIKSLETVRDVCVTGIQHPTEGYYPIAFVVLQKGRKISEKLIIKYVNENVPDHKKLRGGVVFVSKIPRFRDSGSIKRGLFKKIMSKYRLKPGPELENLLDTDKPGSELDKNK